MCSLLLINFCLLCPRPLYCHSHQTISTMSAHSAHTADEKRVETAPLSAQTTPSPSALYDKEHPAHPHHRLDKIATLGLISFSTNLFATSAVLLRLRGASPATSLAALTGPYLFIGLGGHWIPGIIELIQGKREDKPSLLSSSLDADLPVA